MRFRRRDRSESASEEKAEEQPIPSGPEGPPDFVAAVSDAGQDDPAELNSPELPAPEVSVEGSQSLALDAPLVPDLAILATELIASDEENDDSRESEDSTETSIGQADPVSVPEPAAIEERPAEPVLEVEIIAAERDTEIVLEPDSLTPAVEATPSPVESAPKIEEPVPTPPLPREAAVSGTLRDVPRSNGSLKKTRPLPRVIAIANQKGGVGKTTTTVNLGAALSELSYRVLVIDLDPQGNATSGLGIDTRNFESSMYDVVMRDAPIEDCIEPTNVQNLFLTPATIDLAGVEIELVSAFSRELKLKRAIDSVVDDFDFVLIDCPPSLGLLTVNGLAAATEVLVPIQCEYYALEGLSQLLRNVSLVANNLNAGLEVSTIVLTMYDARTRLAVDVADEVREHFADRVCRSIIPRTVRLSEAPSFGQPITVFDPNSRGAVAYRELAKEVSNGAPKRSG
jgi:chromosome partitioning protein